MDRRGALADVHGSAEAINIRMDPDEVIKIFNCVLIVR
jgi:hypothetical protein